MLLTWRERRYRKEHLRQVCHTTLDPMRPGVVRIHLVPPRDTDSNQVPYLVILNGQDILPVTFSWAVLLSAFMDALAPNAGAEIPDAAYEALIAETVKRVKRVYPRTTDETLRGDLHRMLDAFIKISRGEKPDEDVGALSIFDYAPHMRAPHRMGPGSFAWYDFSLEPGGARSIDEAQEAASRQLITQTIEAAAQQTGIPPERTVVGGFSQGGTMALSMLLTRPELMLGCIVWHGRLLAQMQPLEAKADAFHGRKLWVSHGVHDDVVPRSSAQAITHHFDKLPVSVTFREFSSAHEIRPSELAQTLAWLEGLSTTPTAF